MLFKYKIKKKKKKKRKKIADKPEQAKRHTQERRLVRPIDSDRAVKVTDDGERALHTLLDIEPGILR
ncbi:predicted protein [Streptomyces pristinaespiralis ATCC 25486]|uniref:Predicted protein n=1 Tax=Streptomyces pristinaespiralis (strain ATCC 25486 / DSM 40338 / CBS 914.69 / JCM 4507 / KCC S-0507 / NBRC 13074 / NRRL 2958 / 5647) TaxID=457429 RepID=D6X9W5_STRE2|nr:predicted protein [Streptomyces pristinaespiralis ATCC 25486]